MVLDGRSSFRLVENVIGACADDHRLNDAEHTLDRMSDILRSRIYAEYIEAPQWGISRRKGHP